MLVDTIKTEMKEAMKAKDAVKLNVMRGLLAGFTNELVAKGQKPDVQVTDEIALAIIKRQVKQRKDSIEQFTKGNRDDLVKSESAELAILEKFLPATMSPDQIRPVVEKKKAELGVADKSGAGKLIGAVMKELGGTADGADVKRVVEELLS